MAVIGEADASAGIKWAQEVIASGAAEEYALSATSLEDAYIELTGHAPDGGNDGGNGDGSGDGSGRAG